MSSVLGSLNPSNSSVPIPSPNAQVGASSSPCIPASIPMSSNIAPLATSVISQRGLEISQNFSDPLSNCKIRIIEDRPSVDLSENVKIALSSSNSSSHKVTDLSGNQGKLASGDISIKRKEEELDNEFLDNEFEEFKNIGAARASSYESPEPGAASAPSAPEASVPGLSIQLKAAGEEPSAHPVISSESGMQIRLRSEEEKAAEKAKTEEMQAIETKAQADANKLGNNKQPVHTTQKILQEMIGAYKKAGVSGPLTAEAEIAKDTDGSDKLTKFEQGGLDYFKAEMTFSIKEGGKEVGKFTRTIITSDFIVDGKHDSKKALTSLKNYAMTVTSLASLEQAGDGNYHSGLFQQPLSKDDYNNIMNSKSFTLEYTYDPAQNHVIAKSIKTESNNLYEFNPNLKQTVKLIGVETKLHKDDMRYAQIAVARENEMSLDENLFTNTLKEAREAYELAQEAIKTFENKKAVLTQLLNNHKDIDFNSLLAAADDNTVKADPNAIMAFDAYAAMRQARATIRGSQASLNHLQHSIKNNKELGIRGGKDERGNDVEGFFDKKRLWEPALTSGRTDRFTKSFNTQLGEIIGVLKLSLDQIDKDYQAIDSKVKVGRPVPLEVE